VLRVRKAAEEGRRPSIETTLATAVADMRATGMILVGAAAGSRSECATAEKRRRRTTVADIVPI